MGVGDNTAPRFTLKPSIKQDGKSLAFSCQIEASPKPQVSWFCGDKPLSDSARLRTRVEPGAGNKYNISLEIEGVTPQDAGSYKVTAKNNLGEMSASVNLNLGGAPGGADGTPPSFTQKPAIKQEQGGKKLVFESRLVADPAPTITWFKDSLQLSAGAKYKILTQPQGVNEYYVALEVYDVTAKDGANYKVTAKNTLGESNANIKLNFDTGPEQKGTPPKFTQKPTIKQVGDAVVFEVRLLADPPPSIVWYKGNTVLRDSGRHKITQSFDGTSHVLMMEISNVGAEDGGEYRVNAKNNLGESNANLTLNFDMPAQKDGKAPKFLEKPSIKQEGNQLVMQCLVEAKPQPEVSWFQESSPLKQGGRITIKATKGTGADTYSLSLIIVEPKAEDGGNYKCTAKNQFGESNANIALNFAAPEPPKGTAPQFKEKPKISQDPTGKHVTIECICLANPKPAVTWYRGTTIVKDSGRVKLSMVQSQDTYTLVMKIMDVTVDDGGSYKVNAKNNLGESNANINLNFEAPPKKDPPKIKDKPSIKFENDGHRLVLEIKVLSDTKPQAGWFLGNKPIKDGGRFFIDVAREGDAFVLVLEVEDCTPADSGEYKVVVKNLNGETTHSVPVKVAPPAKKKPEPKKGDPPVFTKTLKDVSAMDGDPLNLSAEVKGTEPIQITWYKDKKVLKQTKSFKMTFVKGVATLKLADSFPEDSGVYTVEAVNDIGEDASSATVTIKEPKKKKVPTATLR